MLVVLPFSRPQFVAGILAAVARQTAPVELVVVENGQAVGTFPREHAAVVLRSEVQHHAAARNVGLEWILRRGDGPWVTMDDDDYYGPAYVADAARALETADVTGKVRGFVAFDDGLYRFDLGFAGGELQPLGQRVLTGGTIGARSARQRFQLVLADDAEYCREAHAQGLRVMATSPHGYCYNRRSTHKHTWHASATIARTVLGGDTDYYGALPDSAVDDRQLRPLRRVSPPPHTEIFSSVWSGA